MDEQGLQPGGPRVSFLSSPLLESCFGPCGGVLEVGWLILGVVFLLLPLGGKVSSSPDGAQSPGCSGGAGLVQGPPREPGGTLSVGPGDWEPVALQCFLCPPSRRPFSAELSCSWVSLSGRSHCFGCWWNLDGRAPGVGRGGGGRESG